MDSPSDLDYELLQKIAEQRPASQRALANQLGVSVGKINYCLRAVIDRGWVKVNNFRRADNKLAYSYLLTPSGAAAKLRLARAFLERKEREFELLQGEIANLRQELANDKSNS
ncbi:MarR family EPS-associated transcriptional regulator [Pelomonas sp. KK5]|uniref:MarR family EPS-associated transcriptional regulator n=1 Tax=Pelomonas sp. KK5 TaxID=1855730 RepID=UPI00097C1867|nr:MarR family EPS-associated transcriptional regulator [Pelomonas sp. KK5]